MERLSTRENEFASLNMVNNQYSKYVLSQEDVNFSQNGMNHKNIMDFLLKKKYKYIACLI